MSSLLSKTEKRVQLKSENEWLRNAFRKALNGLIEQNTNVTELTTALILAVVQNGGKVTIGAEAIVGLDPNTRLRVERDAVTQTVTYTTYVEAPQGEITTPDALAGAVAQALPGFTEPVAADDAAVPCDE